MCGSCLRFWGDAYLDSLGRVQQTADGSGSRETNMGTEVFYHPLPILPAYRADVVTKHRRQRKQGFNLHSYITGCN